MASGPDPNRFQTTDPELDASDRAHGDTIGDVKSTRMGLSGWGIVIVALVVAAFVISLMF
jgi:hypothetical protein